jgi:hypothetical protein
VDTHGDIVPGGFGGDPLRRIAENGNATTALVLISVETKTT